MEQDVMKALLEAFEQSDWQEMTVTIGGDRLHISRLASTDGAVREPAAAVPAPVPAPSAPAPDPPAPTAPVPVALPEPVAATPVAPAGSSNGAVDIPPGTQITSPSVGLFWRAPSPGAPPFVEVGGPVNAGDTVAIVEVMKLMNHVTAPATGTVAAILVDNGAPVEFGQVLVVIESDA